MPFNYKSDSFCCEECYNMFQVDPQMTPPVVLSYIKLREMFKTANPPVIASVKKVVSIMDRDNCKCNGIFIIYLCKSDSKSTVIPPDTLYAITQIKTASFQVVLDCLLSPEYAPLGPVWPSVHSNTALDEFSLLLEHEFTSLALQCGLLK